MQIIATCPQCNRQSLFAGNCADKRKRCSHCGKLIKIPPARELVRALAVLKDAKTVVYVDETGKVYA
jgi:uncharacterized protein (DUF983 family)